MSDLKIETRKNDNMVEAWLHGPDGPMLLSSVLIGIIIPPSAETKDDVQKCLKAWVDMLTGMLLICGMAVRSVEHTESLH